MSATRTVELPSILGKGQSHVTNRERQIGLTKPVLDIMVSARINFSEKLTEAQNMGSLRAWTQCKQDSTYVVVTHNNAIHGSVQSARIC
jgi:hypothetical protein